MFYAQLEDKKNFLREMSRGAANRQADPQAVRELLTIIAIVTLVIVLTYLLLRYQKSLFGRFTKWRKRFGGRPIGGDRYRYQMEVVLNLPIGRGQISRTTTANISPGGMFVKLDPPLERDQLFRFKLNLSDTESVSGIAEVMWVQDKWSERFPTGVGVRFRDLSQKDRNRIRLWIQKNRFSKR